MTVRDDIRANADIVVRKLSEVSGIDDFGYNADSVTWVDGFIERQRVRSAFDEVPNDRLSRNLACYLGECVIACYGGHWQQLGGAWAIVFNADNAVFPFGKVYKQFANGREGGDSIDGWFRAIPEIFARQIGPELREKRGWWKLW